MSSVVSPEKRKGGFALLQEDEEDESDVFTIGETSDGSELTAEAHAWETNESSQNQHMIYSNVDNRN